MDFSDKTFSIYFDEEFGIDIDDEKYKFQGTSKGNRLRSLIEIENEGIVSRILRSLWDYRASILEKRGTIDDASLSELYFKIIYKLEGAVETANTDALENFILNETLDELIASIHRDISADKPQAALDRLHTYCMKKFSHLVSLRGEVCNQNEPLNSRVGKYIKLLENETDIHEISLRIMKSSISIFDAFNDVRNNRSFAHDNEIMGLHEARFIFDSVSNILRFIRSVEANHFGG